MYIPRTNFNNDGITKKIHKCRFGKIFFWFLAAFCNCTSYFASASFRPLNFFPAMIYIYIYMYIYVRAYIFTMYICLHV